MLRFRVNPIRTVAAAVLVIGSGSIAAQTSPQPGTPVNAVSSVPGLTDVQRPVALVIDSICPYIGAGTPYASPGQLALSNSCTKMVISSLALTNSAPGGTSQFNLGLNAGDLRTAVQAIGNEEAVAQGRRSIEARSRSPVNGRLLALRAGARGMSVAGLSLSGDGRSIQLANLLPAEVRGGGAAADDTKWGGFINLNYNTGDRSGTDRENSFDFRNTGITAGVDYRINPNLFVGAALSYDKSDVDFNNNLGFVDSDVKGISLYGGATFGDAYVDVHLSQSRLSFDTARNIVIPSRTTTAAGINTVATASPKGDQTSASLGAGFNIVRQNLTITPYGRMEYLRLALDGYSENEPNAGLGLDVDSRTAKSFQTGIGVRGQMAISTGFGVVTPYASVEWNHEFENDQGSVVAKYTFDPFNRRFVLPGDSPDRNYYTLALGVSAVLPRGMSGFFQYETVQGLRNTTNHAFTLGVRAEF